MKNIKDNKVECDTCGKIYEGNGDSVCPNCGSENKPKKKGYTPMSPEKQKNIRFVITIILLIVFAIIMYARNS